MPFSLEDDAPPASSESAAILANMPEPQQHAIDAETRNQAEAAGVENAPPTPPPNALLDAAGVVWDPAVHATGKDGKGVPRADGTWRARRGVAAHRSTVGGTSRVATPVQDTTKEQAMALAQCQAAGGAAASSIFMLGRVFGGEKWQPTEAEVKIQSDAWTAYFQAKGVTEFPPGFAVAIAVAGYAGPRLFLPETKERAGRIKHWFAVRIARRRVQRELRKRGIEARVTIKGSTSADVYDSILIDGKPFKENGARSNTRDDFKR